MKNKFTFPEFVEEPKFPGVVLMNNPNATTGATRTAAYIKSVEDGTYGGLYFVSTLSGKGSVNYIMLCLEADPANADANVLFKPLRPFGITNEMQIVLSSLREMYLPAKMYELIRKIPDSAEARIVGLIEYLTGIVKCVCKFVGFCPNGEYELASASSTFPAVDGRSLSVCLNRSCWSGASTSLRFTSAIPFDEYKLEGKYKLLQFETLSAVRAVKAVKDTTYAVYPNPVSSAFAVLKDTCKCLYTFLPEAVDHYKPITLGLQMSKNPETQVLVPVSDELRCSEDSRTRLCTVYNFRIKGTMSAKDFEVESVRDTYKDDPLAQELYKTVPEFYDHIDMRPYRTFVAGVAHKSIRFALFFGESGTGKSTIARAIFHTIGLPYAVLNCSVNIEESDIVGTMIPNPKKMSADDPEFIWRDGVLTTAARYGYGIVIEEINFAHPGVLGLLNSLLDDAHTLVLPTGESVIAHENFRLIATGNLGYEGTNRLNSALVNRFNIIHTFDTPNEIKTLAIIKQRTGFENDAQLKKLYAAITILRKYMKDQNLTGAVSLRQLLNLIACGKYYPDMRAAFRDIVLQGALIEYPEQYEEFNNNVLSTLPLDFKLDTVEAD